MPTAKNYERTLRGTSGLKPNMSDNPVYVSQAGLEKMKAELHQLKTVTRREVADRIEKAKELGDLRENADYQSAKEELSFIEGRILELGDAVNRAEIIRAGDSGSVSIGCRVKVKFDGKEKDFTIVGSTESDPIKGMISNESPLGRALIGKKIGEEAEVKVPAGMLRYTIVEIEC